MGNLISLFFLILLVSCGKNLPVTKPNTFLRDQIVNLPISTLAGEIVTSEGTTIAINTNRVKPLVLVFASDTCAVCTEETKAFVKHLEANGARDLSNTDYITILIGAFPEDVDAWIKRLSVTWTVGTEFSDNLFEIFCPEKLTPCIVTFNPEKKRLTKFLGTTSIERIQEETGYWSYHTEEN